MPVSLSKVRERQKQLEVDVGDGDMVKFTYRPGVYTADFEASIRDGMKEGDRDTLGKAFSLLLTEWDIYEDAKQTKVLPISPEGVSQLPIVLLMPIIQGINEDMRPKQKTGGSFDAG